MSSGGVCGGNSELSAPSPIMQWWNAEEALTLVTRDMAEIGRGFKTGTRIFLIQVITRAVTATEQQASELPQTVMSIIFQQALLESLGSKLIQADVSRKQQKCPGGTYQQLEQIQMAFISRFFAR